MIFHGLEEDDHDNLRNIDDEVGCGNRFMIDKQPYGLVVSLIYRLEYNCLV
jgi:hypothetical protein